MTGPTLPPPRRLDWHGGEAAGDSDLEPDELYADPPLLLIFASLGFTVLLFVLAAFGLAGLLTGGCP